MKFNKHSLRQISPYLLIGAFYIIAIWVIGIGGDFPLNDDWAYAEGVRHLLQGDGLIMPNVCAAGIAHVGFGFVAAKLLGYSYVSLRICSFLITVAGAVAFFVTAASFRIPRTQATFLTLLYAANPLLINVCFGFMSDSTALALNMIFLACVTRGLVRRSLNTLAMAFFILALAVTTRQSALIFLVLSPFCLSKRFGATRSKYFVFAFALALPMLAAWACDRWLMNSFIDSGSTNIGYDLVRNAHSAIIQKFICSAPDMIMPSLSAFGQVLCYLALFCLPALAALFVEFAIKRQVKFITLKVFVLLFVCELALAGVNLLLYRQTMPFSENILRFTTVGAQGLLGIIRQPLDAHGRMVITILSFIFSLPLLLVLAGSLPKSQKKIDLLSAVVTAFMLACLGFLTIETIVRCTDRYYLVALGPSLLAIGFYAKRSRINLVNPISTMLLVSLVCYSIAGNQEYLSSNRARWRAIEWLEKTGVTSAATDGGYEYNVLRDMSLYNTTYRGAPPRDKWRWWSVKGETYLVSFSPVPGYETIHSEPYFSLLDLKRRNIEVLKCLPTAGK